MKTTDIKGVIAIEADGKYKTLYIDYNDGRTEKVEYSPEYGQKIIDFLEANGISTENNPNIMVEARENGLLYSFDEEKDKDIVEKIEQEYQNNLEEDESLAVEKNIKGKKVARGVLAGVGAAAVLAGVGAGVASCTKQNQNGKKSNVDFDTASFDELMKAMPTDSEKRIFCQNIYDVTEKLNANCLDKEIFALEADGDAVLQFNYDEVIAAKLVLNDYTVEELSEILDGEGIEAIFGKDANVNEQYIMNLYQKFATKLGIYSMNAKEASGVSLLIENEGNREWFEQVENSIVSFNKSPSLGASDKVIRNFAYFYSHGVNGVDNIENDEATINCVKNLALQMVRGYYDANVEEGYNQYLTVYYEPDDFDSKYRTNNASQVQKGETLLYYINLAETGKCSISTVQSHISNLLDKAARAQDSEQNYDSLLRNKLAEAVLDAGDTELANKVMTEGVTPKVEKEFENGSKASRNALKKYKDAISVSDNMPTLEQIKNAADRELGVYEEVKDDVLYNNRIRGLEKIDSKDSPIVTKEEWNKMSSEEKLAFAKKNGIVQSTTTKTTSSKVSYNDLSDAEKKEADKQKEQLNYEVDGYTFSTVEQKEAYMKGKADGVAYTTEKNAYKSDPIYNKVNPDAVSVVPTYGKLYDTAKAEKAFNDKEITINDPQIQKRLENDIEKYKTQNNVTSSNLVNSYKLGWVKGVKDALEEAQKNGLIEREKAERLYEEAKKAAEEKNNNQNDVPIVEESPTNDNNNTTAEQDIPVYDENEDSYLAGPVGSDDGRDEYYDENFEGTDTRTYVASTSPDTYDAEVTTSDIDLDKYVALAMDAVNEYLEQANSNEKVLVK